jgi:OmpA-OmpF porin, OOP family
MRLPDNLFDDDDYRVSPWVLGCAGALALFLALGTTGGLFFRSGSPSRRATKAETEVGSWADRNDAFKTPIKSSAAKDPAVPTHGSVSAGSKAPAGSSGTAADSNGSDRPEDSMLASNPVGKNDAELSSRKKAPLTPVLASAGPASGETPQSPAPTVAAKVARDPAAFVATASRDGSILLVGLVPSQADRDRFGEAFKNELPLGTRLVNRLQVDPTITLDHSALEIDGQARLLLFDALQGLAKTGIGESKVTITSTFHLVRPSLLETSLNVLFAAEPIEFAKGSAVISETSYATIDSATEFLFRDKLGMILLEGHTDNDGTPEANLALSTARAQAVRAALIANGVSATRLSALGRGQEQPIADNSTEAGKQRNRRVEAVLVEEEPPSPLAETLD